MWNIWCVVSKNKIQLNSRIRMRLKNKCKSVVQREKKIKAIFPSNIFSPQTFFRQTFSRQTFFPSNFFPVKLFFRTIFPPVKLFSNVKFFSPSNFFPVKLFPCQTILTWCRCGIWSPCPWFLPWGRHRCRPRGTRCSAAPQSPTQAITVTYTCNHSHLPIVLVFQRSAPCACTKNSGSPQITLWM